MDEAGADREDGAAPHRGARRRRWVTSVAATTCVLAGVAVIGGLLTGSEEPPPDAAALPGRTYEFRVTGSPGDALIVSPGGPGPARRERPDTPLPWIGRVTVPAGRPAPLMAVSALSRDPRSGWIACSIVRDGVIIDERTGTGLRPFANCHGR